MNYYAEFNTDKYIIENFFLGKKDGIMLETGAGPTVEISMSKSFRENGWRTICVEPNPYYVDMHKKEKNEIYQYALSNEIAYNHDFEIANPDTPYQLSSSAIKIIRNDKDTVNKKIIKVDIVTLNWLLNSLGLSKLDFVSIDVEGWEIEVMEGFDTSIYKPLIILLENLYDDNYYNIYMNDIKYTLINKIFFNYIYKRNDE